MPSGSLPHIVLRMTGLESRARIEALADRRGWPVVIGAAPMAKGFVLEYEQGRLQLRDLEQPKIKPVFVDFLSEALTHRRKHGLSRSQIFAKAIGVTARPGRTVLDTTAGMGVDAFFLAALDCKVTALERSPIVFELLQDGFERALHNDDIGPWLADDLKFVQADASRYLAALKGDERPQVIYLDPMYPETAGKSALPKKEMQLFRKLIGGDDDSARVLELAREKALDRVVVKRPNEAPPLGPGVTHAFTGKTLRYDMYSVRKTRSQSSGQ